MMKSLYFFISALIAFPAFAQKARNLIIITPDGQRWEELFRGADSALLFGDKYNKQSISLRTDKYWAASEKERREKLMPFLWSHIATHGQLYGNRDLGNKVDVKNPYWFSYPGYNEMFTGYADTQINTNSYPPNPNINVLEFLNKQKKYRNRVAVFHSWNVVSNILNEERSGLMISAGWKAFEAPKLTETQKSFNFQRLLLPRFSQNSRWDAITYSLAKEYMRTYRPRVLYIGFEDTDVWGHDGRYDYYLDAIHSMDKMLEDLWNTIQSDPFYRNNTTILLTTDHGRGRGDQWKDHHHTVPHSEQIWFAVMGPDTPALGEIREPGQLYQNQFAKTIAALLGFDFTSIHPIGEPVHTMINR